MPWPTYSERFLHHTQSGYWIYTVPVGTRAIITNIDAVETSAELGNASVAVGPVLLLNHFFRATWDSYNAVVRCVAYQGEQIVLGMNTDGVHCSVNGYLMADSSGHTGPPGGAAQLPAPELPPMPERPPR